MTRLAKPREALKRSLSAACVGEVLRRPHHLAELVAVDVVDRAELLDQLALLVGGDDADRVGAGRLAELHGEDAEAAGRAPDQDVVAGLQLALVDQHPVGGEVGEAVGGGVGPGEVLGAGEELLRLHLGELGEGAPGRLVAPDLLARRGERVEPVHLDVLVGGLVAVDDDLVARLPAGDALADLPDDARGVGAADVVAVLGVVAVAEDRDRLAQRRPDVVEVDAGGHHPHDHLEGAGLRHLDLLELEGVVGLALALLADHPGGHRLRQLAGLDVQLRDCARVNGQL